MIRTFCFNQRLSSCLRGKYRPTPGTCAIYLRVLYWLLVLVHLSPHHFTKLLGVRCLLWRSLRKDCCTSGLKLEWFLWLTTGLNMRILPTVSTKNFPQIQRSHKSLSFPSTKNNYSIYIYVPWFGSKEIPSGPSVFFQYQTLEDSISNRLEELVCLGQTWAAC